MKLLAFTFVLLLGLTIVTCQTLLDLRLIREWKQLDFNFPTASIRVDAIRRGLFVPLNAFPIDVDVDYRVSLVVSRIFVTIPRFSDGVPVTLGYFKSPSTDNLIQPYPDYSWHSSNGANCDGITSVLRVAIDKCHQLWVLDTGKVGDVVKCPPQLLVFDLTTDKLVKRYRFPSSQYTAASLFITPVLDVKNVNGRCDNTMVYIADVTGFALIVYDSLANKSWRIQNKLFLPNAASKTFTIAGESFDMMDGIFGLALSPKGIPYNNRVLYFHSLAATTENYVPLPLISNSANWLNNPNAFASEFRTLGSRGIQTAAQAMDSNGNLFFVLMNPIALVCWDTSTEYSTQNIRIVVQNDITLQFASGLKIIKNLSGIEELWVLTNRFQKIANGTLNSNEVNYRIQVRIVSELLRGYPRCYGPPLGSSC